MPINPTGPSTTPPSTRAAEPAASSPPAPSAEPAAAPDSSFSSSGGTSTAGSTAWNASHVPGAASPLSVMLNASASSSDQLAAEALLGQLRPLLTGDPNRGEEAQVLALLRGASPYALNHALKNLDFHEVVEGMDDRWFGPDNRKALFALLGTERVDDLDIATRAHLIHGVQEGTTDGQREHLIRDILIATRGPDLTALKNAIDASFDHHDLLALVDYDIDDNGLRAEVLAHIEAEAIGVSTSHPKVLSDIDDTLYANLKDNRFPGKTVYPGVIAFYEQLSGFTVDDERPSPLVTFLTARPEDPTGFVEDYTHHAVTGLGAHHAAVLSGDIGHVFGNDAIAAKKKDNFERFARVYPEYKTVFVGDSGQGDKQLTEPDATFIHNVNGMGDVERAELRANGVYVFDTYAGAAVEAYEQGLLDAAGLRAVADAARGGLEQVVFSDPTQRAARVAELNADLERVNAWLDPGDAVPLVG